MVYYDHVLVYTDRSIVHFADADSAHIFIVIDGTDQYLCGGIRVSFRSGNVFQNRLKERNHIFRLVIEFQNGVSGFGRSVDKRAVELAVVCIQIHEKLQCLIDDSVRTGFRAVNFVDTDNDREL